MAKRLSPFNFTKAVMRSFMAESGLEPRYEQATIATSCTLAEDSQLTQRNQRQTAAEPSRHCAFQTCKRPSLILISCFQQFRVVNAAEGKVDFELDIHKDHTVSWLPLPRMNVKWSLWSFEILI